MDCGQLKARGPTCLTRWLGILTTTDGFWDVGLRVVVVVRFVSGWREKELRFDPATKTWEVFGGLMPCFSHICEVNCYEGEITALKCFDERVGALERDHTGGWRVSE